MVSNLKRRCPCRASTPTPVLIVMRMPPDWVFPLFNLYIQEVDPGDLLNGMRESPNFTYKKISLGGVEHNKPHYCTMVGVEKGQCVLTTWGRSALPQGVQAGSWVAFYMVHPFPPLFSCQTWVLSTCQTLSLKWTRELAEESNGMKWSI